MYHTWTLDADAEYLGRVRMALSSNVGSIHFADPANIRVVHEELMSQAAMELNLHSSFCLDEIQQKDVYLTLTIAIGIIEPMKEK